MASTNEAIKTRLIESLEQLGVDVDLRTFSNRKKLQKLTYLIEATGLDLGYRFTWYLHGPYSPDLTKDLYESSERPAGGSGQLSVGDKQRLSSLQNFLGSDIKSSDTLELIGSLHYIIMIGKESGRTNEEVLRLFKKLKPQFSEELVNFYYDKVSKLIESTNTYTH